MHEGGDHERQLLLLHGHPVLVVHAVEDAGGGLRGPEDLVGVLQRQVTVGADHPRRALGAGFAQIGLSRTVGDHQRHHEGRPAKFVPGVELNRCPVDEEGDDGGDDPCPADLDVASDRGLRGLHQERQAGPHDQHRQHQERVRAMEGQGHASQGADADLLPAAELASVEQQQRRPDHQQAGEDIRHGEGRHPRQARSHRKGGHQGVVAPARRLARDRPPEQEDHPGAGEGLHRGQQPKGAAVGQAIEEDAVVG